MPRDELQGVVAHEFSHIKHGDMRLNIRLMGLIFGLMALVYLGWTIIRIGFHSAAMARKKEDAGGLALVLPGLALVVVGGVGAFFGSLLKAMVSRQREYLADASAVQYTRNPAGIANALRRLGGVGSSVKHKNAAESSHMFFGRGVSSLFATHPPIDKRVEAIDPGGQWTSGKLPPEPEIQLESRGVQSVPNSSAAGFVGHAAVAAAQATTERVQDAVGDAADDLLGAVASVFAILALEDEDPRTFRSERWLTVDFSRSPKKHHVCFPGCRGCRWTTACPFGARPAGDGWPFGKSVPPHSRSHLGHDRKGWGGHSA